MGDEWRDFDDGACRELVSAVIADACREWMRAKNKLRYAPGDKYAWGKVVSVERFLLGAWMESLSGVDGKALLHRLREAEEEAWEEKQRARQRRLYHQEGFSVGQGLLSED